jgi:hypothetical protein
MELKTNSLDDLLFRIGPKEIKVYNLETTLSWGSFSRQTKFKLIKSLLKLLKRLRFGSLEPVLLKHIGPRNWHWKVIPSFRDVLLFGYISK